MMMGSAIAKSRTICNELSTGQRSNKCMRAQNVVEMSEKKQKYICAQRDGDQTLEARAGRGSSWVQALLVVTMQSTSNNIGESCSFER